MNKEESIRLHTDWWGECRTCKFWDGDRFQVKVSSRCKNGRSPLFEAIVFTSGYCKAWDTFDDDVAFEILEQEYKEGEKRQ